LNAGSVHPSGTLTEGAGRAPQNAAERPQKPLRRGLRRIMAEKRQGNRIRIHRNYEELRIIMCVKY